MKKTLIDIVPVLVGILLALIISNWQQTVSEKKYIEESIQAIIQENQSNIDELDNSLRRQAIFIDTLRKYSSDEYSLFDVIKRVPGLTTPDLRSTTWKFLIQDSKHTLVNYEFINRLAEIEKYETLVNRHNQKVLDMIYQPSFFTDPKVKDVAQVMVADFTEIEKALKKALEDFNSFAKEEGF